MNKNAKISTIALILLVSTLLITVLSEGIVVEAQEDQATVIILPTLGGTTSPPPNTYTYPDGETITLIATPNEGFEFLYWVISGEYTTTHNQPPLIVPEVYLNDPNWVPDLPNPDRTGIDSLQVEQERLDVICGYGYTFTYQAVFAPTVGGQGSDAVVIVKDAIGGTTTPDAGTYTYAEGETITLIATPSTGYEFLYWIISGEYVTTHNQPPLIVPEVYLNDPNYVPDLPNPDRTGIDNLVLSQSRLDVICGYGYTFTYQPVFAPTSISPSEPSEAIVVVLESAGGTSLPGPGTYTYTEGQTITLTATATEGFEFLYWIISGDYVPTHNRPPLIVPEIYVDDPSWVPDLPTPDASGIDSLVIEQERLDVICGYGYTYSYQPIFAPIEADVPTPSEPGTSEPEQPTDEGMIHPPLGLSAEAIIALIAILVAAVVIAVLFGFYTYRKGKK